MLLVTILKYNKFVTKEKLSKKINVKQFPTLVEVHLITGLLSSRSNLWFLMITKLFHNIIVVMYKNVLLILYNRVSVTEL